MRTGCLYFNLKLISLLKDRNTQSRRHVNRVRLHVLSPPLTQQHSEQGTWQDKLGLFVIKNT